MASTGLKILYYFTTLLLILSLVGKVRAQSGQMGDNYSGFSEAVFNPALGVLSRNYLELNILSVNSNLTNNYLYLHRGDYSMFDWMKRNPVFPSYGRDNLPFDHFNNDETNHGFTSAKITGPGFLAHLPRSAIGFSASSVNSASFTNIPTNVANLLYYTLDIPSQFNIYFENTNLNVSALSGIEYQLHYSRILRTKRQNMLTAGINVSFTHAFSGSYLHAGKFAYILLNDTVMNIRRFDGELGFSLPLNYSDTTFAFGGLKFNGSGIDADIGIVYTRLLDEPILHRYNKPCESPYQEFQYRIGISLNDLGRVRFGKNAQQHRYENLNDLTWNSSIILPTSTIDSIFQGISEHFLGGSEATLSAKQFEIWQPASLNLLADVNLTRNVFLNFRVILPVNLAPNQLHKPSLVAVFPQYQTEKFAISLPLSWHQYQKLNVGLAARFHYLTIGTERLGPWLGTGNFTGADVYFSFRYFLLKGSCSGISKAKDCRDLRF